MEAYSAKNLDMLAWSDNCQSPSAQLIAKEAYSNLELLEKAWPARDQTHSSYRISRLQL